MKHNITIDFIEIACECVDWLQLAQNRTQWQAVLNPAVKFHVL